MLLYITQEGDGPIHLDSIQVEVYKGIFVRLKDLIRDYRQVEDMGADEPFPDYFNVTFVRAEGERT